MQKSETSSRICHLDDQRPEEKGLEESGSSLVGYIKEKEGFRHLLSCVPCVSWAALNCFCAVGCRLGLLVNFGHYPRLEWEPLVE